MKPINQLAPLILTPRVQFAMAYVEQRLAAAARTPLAASKQTERHQQSEQEGAQS